MLEGMAVCDGDEFLTMDEVCDHLRISRTALYGLRQAGAAPPAIRIGRQLRFRRSDLEDWLSTRPTWPPEGAA